MILSKISLSSSIEPSQIQKKFRNRNNKSLHLELMPILTQTKRTIDWMDNTIIMTYLTLCMFLHKIT